MTRILIAILLLTFCVAIADASVVPISPPLDLRTGATESPDKNNLSIFLIQERQVTLPDDLLVDGLVDTIMGPGGVLPAGTVVQSWLFHFDKPGADDTNRTASGVYNFKAPIVGVLFTEDGLDDTDQLFGNPGTIYPTGVYYRDSDDSSDPPDMWSIVNPKVIHFDALQNDGVGIDQVRVLTSSVPEPSTLVIWCIIGVVALLGIALCRK